MNAPSLKSVFVVKEGPMFGGIKEPKDDPAYDYAKRTGKHGNPLLQPDDPELPGGEIEGQNGRQRMGAAVKKYLGTNGELSQAMSAAAEEVGDLADNADPKKAERIMAAFEKAMAAARMINRGKAESVREARSPQQMEDWIDAHADVFVGIPNENQAKITLRSVLKSLGKDAPGSDKAKDGSKAEPEKVPPTQAAASSGEPKAAQGKAGSAPAAQGSDARSIRNQLLQGLPDIKQEPGLTLARSTTKMANYLATHPASDPSKVKAFVTAWQAFSKELAGVTLGKAFKMGKKK